MYAQERLNACYEQGLADEAKVIKFLQSEGYQVDRSSQTENKQLDIDCWVNGKPVSIKSNHKGASFRNIGFELINQLTKHQNCYHSEQVIAAGLTLESIDTLVNSGSWELGWFYTGTASNYLFYQGTELRLYTKKSIESYINRQGFLRIRQLTDDCKSYLGGRYRHCNSISGYLHWSSVPHRLWQVTDK